MFNHRKFKAGSYISIAPLGLLCTLVYDERGILSKIFPTLHIKPDSECLDWKLTTALIEHHIVPQRIHLNSGLTYVEGVFYTSRLLETCGDLPHCLDEEISSILETSPEALTFYAGTLKNNTILLAHHNTITTRMKTCGFNVLPGCVQYEEMELPVKSILQTSSSSFEYPDISGCFVFEAHKDAEFIYAETSQHKVKSITTDFDEHGYLISKIECSNYEFYTPYSEVVSHNIQPGVLLMLDDNEIIKSVQTDRRRRTALTRDLTCKVCNRKYQSALSGHTFCPDPHCASRLYPQLSQFIRILDLPAVSFLEVKPLIENGTLTYLPDLFLLDQYKDVKVRCTLSNLLSAVVPVEVYRNAKIFQSICAKTVTTEAFMYYVDNPEHIKDDLGITDARLDNIVEWLNDPHNNLLLKTITTMSNIEIVSGIQKFKCAPIFRGKKIAIIGDFVHGGTEDIMSILTSYYADVVLGFDRTCNVVVVGDRSVDACESEIELANAYSIPVYTESSFFTSFEIDQDLSKIPH